MESLAFESKIKLTESRIPLMTGIWNLSFADKASEIQYLESGIQERGIQNQKLSCILLHGSMSCFDVIWDVHFFWRIHCKFPNLKFFGFVTEVDSFHWRQHWCHVVRIGQPRTFKQQLFGICPSFLSGIWPSYELNQLNWGQPTINQSEVTIYL